MDEEIFDFGYRLKKLRNERGWSQPDLAKRLETTKETIYRYENNLQTPTFEKVKKLAAIFRTSVDFLIGWENDPVIKLHGLNEKQRQAIFAFCDAFLNTDDT